MEAVSPKRATGCKVNPAALPRVHRRDLGVTDMDLFQALP
jgi:hypothetical protein